MATANPSVRLRVDIQSKSAIIFSYPDLLKRHAKTINEAPTGPMATNDEEDPFYKALLDRAAKYDMNPGGEDVDSGEEDNQNNKDTKGDEYDYDDPFIDDSEMMLDDHYEYTQPEFDGYFVYHGALDGSDNTSGTKKRSKKDKPSTATGKSKSSASTGSRKTKGDTIEISDTEEDLQKPTASTSSSTKTKKSSSQQKSDATKGGPTMKKSTSSSTTSSTTAPSDTTKKSSVKASKGAGSTTTTKSATSGTSNTTPSSSSTTATGDSSSKKSGKLNSSKLQPLHPSIEILMEKVRVDRAKESFEVKSKFPASLRPTVLEMATKMFRLYHKVDENVINHLIDILPYNRFTMKKFLTTKAGNGIVAEYQAQIEKLIGALKVSVEASMPEHIHQYEQKLMEHQNDPTGPDVEKKFRCNETIRRTLYDILTLDMYSVTLSNEIAEFNNRNEMVESETKARKAMYAKLLPCWPTGWMTTYDISRQYSTYKAKMKNTEDSSVKLGLSSNAQTSSPSTTTTMSSSGTKRSTMTPVKRSAPSTTSASAYNGSQGNGNSEKRKKMSINEGPSDSEPNRATQESTLQEMAPQEPIHQETAHQESIPYESTPHDPQVRSDNISLQESPSLAENIPSLHPSSHKPSSMNIASLISDP